MKKFMKMFVSLCFASLLMIGSSLPTFAATMENQNTVPQVRSNYYFTSGYTTLDYVWTGLGTSSIEVYNDASNGAGIWIRIADNEQAIHMGGSAAWTVGFGRHQVQGKIGDGPVGTYSISINVAV